MTSLYQVGNNHNFYQVCDISGYVPSAILLILCCDIMVCKLDSGEIFLWLGIAEVKRETAIICLFQAEAKILCTTVL